ncbi:integrase core domain-containing protein [Streptomyces cocklensis]|uniref:Integrase n=1 Tax=Actinacidiphila cocklensis TaxID=887465 RepID=A0A9W4E8F0_9ACTN|nr:integrase core domain-containing protein [Actinacidiphila cocklensis]MDD1063469.1 integrase core domain-containing protein [Actinacidiphila cocklensis]CAG6395306.1 Integrase [Actinacidiphila cocklensis]
MLPRLAYLAATNAFAVLRLLPVCDRDNDIEILALRHQLLVLQSQVGKPTFTDTDRVILSGLLHHLPTDKLRNFLLLLRPDTIMRWHRDLLKRRHAATCAPKRRGRPPTVRSIRALILRLVRENSSWGYRRIHGELAALGIKVAASTVWEILKDHGIPPAPERQNTTWAAFLRGQASALLACDFFESCTLTGARLYVFAVIEHSTRRIRILGATAHPTAGWVVQLGRNLLMDLQDASSTAKFLIRDRDSKFTAAFDALLADAGIEIVKSGVRMPRMNSIMERWIQTCRHELLDRTLIWRQSHLLHALEEFETFYNGHRPHRALDQAAPLRPLSHPLNEPAQIRRLEVHRRDRLGGTLHQYHHAA